MSKCWKVLDDIYTSSGTFDIFVVTTGLGFLTQRLALRIAGDEGSDSDAVLSAHDTLGRGHVHLQYHSGHVFTTNTQDLLTERPHV